MSRKINITDIQGPISAANTISIKNLRNSIGIKNVAEFLNLQSMLSNTTLTYSNVSVGDLITTTEEDFTYKIIANTANVFHLSMASGIKLMAMEASGELYPEQLNYTDSSANFHSCAQKILDTGYIVKLGPKEYLTSNTVYIRSKTGIIGCGDRISGIKVAPGVSCNVIDTENYSLRVSTGSLQNDDEVVNGALYGTVLRDFYIDGNRQNVPAGTATSGIGVRLYCRMPAITNLRITYCAAHGMQTVLPSGTADPFDSLDHSRIGFVMGLWVMDCGYEGWIFQGPDQHAPGRARDRPERNRLHPDRHGGAGERDHPGRRDFDRRRLPTEQRPQPRHRQGAGLRPELLVPAGVLRRQRHGPGQL